MLLIVDHECLHPFGDGVAVLGGVDFEWPQWRMPYENSSHNIAIIFAGLRDVASVMQCIESSTHRNKILDRHSLLLGHPRYRFCRRKIASILQVPLIRGIEVRADITIWPDDTFAHDQKELVGLE